MAATGVRTDSGEGPRTGGLAALVEAARPAQWVKNGFVLTPLVFAAKVSDPALVARELAAFAAFCLAASGVYIWNDCLDRQADLDRKSVV